jgi:hypothetical protein
MAGTIIFNGIYINAQETNAGVFVGQSTASGWDSHNKNQMSVGMIFNGYGSSSLFPGNLFLLSDNDFIDTAITDTDVEGGPTSQI